MPTFAHFCSSPDEANSTAEGRAPRVHSLAVQCADGEVSFSQELLRHASPLHLDAKLAPIDKGGGKSELQAPGTTRRQWQLLAGQLYPVHWPKPELSLKEWLELLPLAHTYRISSVKDQARSALTPMLRGQLSLSPDNVGYIAKWLRVAEQYQLAWLKDVVLAAWKEMPSAAVQQALAGRMGKDLKQLTPGTLVEAMLMREAAQGPTQTTQRMQPSAETSDEDGDEELVPWQHPTAEPNDQGSDPGDEDKGPSSDEDSCGPSSHVVSDGEGHGSVLHRLHLGDDGGGSDDGRPGSDDEYTIESLSDICWGPEDMSSGFGGPSDEGGGTGTEDECPTRFLGFFFGRSSVGGLGSGADSPGLACGSFQDDYVSSEIGDAVGSIYDYDSDSY